MMGTDYFLFFATKNRTGLRKMKEAMWGVDQSGEFTFSDGTNPDQMLLFGKHPNLAVLRGEITTHFAGRETTVGSIEQFVVERTAFRETHYKAVLRELEQMSPPGVIVLNAPATRRRGTFADKAMRLKFS